MRELTDDQGTTSIMPSDPPRKIKPTTVGIPPDVMKRLRAIELMKSEPHYSIVERLLDEHDIRDMRKAVLKRVR